MAARVIELAVLSKMRMMLMLNLSYSTRLRKLIF